MRRLFRQFSTPGGIPSHVSVPTPGSIHEGGELGYVLAHAFGAAFDNPDLIVAAVVGDGEAETGPLEGSWKGISFLNPARDGAVLPILHLNGYKIAGPTVLGRAERRRRPRACSRGHGYDVALRRGRRPARGAPATFAATLDALLRAASARSSRRRARTASRDAARAGRRSCCARRRAGPGPKVVDGVPVEGTFRAHQVPLAERARQPRAPRACSRRGCAATGPRSCSTTTAGSIAELRRARARRATGAWARTRTPTAAGCSSPLDLPDFARLRGRRAAARRRERARVDAPARRDAARHLRAQRDAGELPPLLPRRDQLEPARRVFEVENRCFVGADRSTSTTTSSPDGRVMEVLSEHNCEGWLEGYLLTGRHGLFATYEAFAHGRRRRWPCSTRSGSRTRDDAAVARAGRRR